MKKLKNNAGFTLVEMLAVVAILVVLVMGMGTTMDAGVQIYRDATFEADSASLAGILNNSLGDILRYSTELRANTATAENPNAEGGFVDSTGTILLKEDVGFVFTNYEYGIRDAYFYTQVFADNTSKGVLQMRNLKNSEVVELVNTGAYPGLAVTNFVITYVEEGAEIDGTTETLRGGYFDITYDIISESNDQLKRQVSTVIRLMNQPK